MTSYSDYDRFAWVYNKHWGSEYTQRVLPILENLVLRRLPAKARILDLCCGTGQLARALIALGYRVTGLDGSEEMLHFARENAPAGKFIVADARSFKLPDVYHAVVSTFDSLNHIMTLDELTDVFRNTYDALRKGGLFFFDLNTEEGYKATWHDSFGVVEDNLVCIVRSNYRPEEQTAQFDTTIFYLQGGWQRSDLTLLQKCYSEVEVQAALKTAGFTKTHAYACNEQRGVEELTRDAERAFFVCQKPVRAKKLIG
ncbi:class I SAM-dependent DNA methyltransferase [Chloroflexota bacterium]